MAEQGELRWLLAAVELAHGQCYSFEIAMPQIEGFLLNWHGTIHAYRNACPHTGVNLNWAPHQFFDIDTRFVQCGMHGALFEPDSGRCIWGPCRGQSLTCLPIRIIDEQIHLVIAKNS